MTGYTPSSGNVFADLGLANPGEHRLKAWIVTHIDRRIRADGLGVEEAAQRMGLAAPNLSGILDGRFADQPVERLARYLSMLGDEVRVTIRGTDGDTDVLVLDAAQ